jgi:hypothetical protein
MRRTKLFLTVVMTVSQLVSMGLALAPYIGKPPQPLPVPPNYIYVGTP